MFLVALLVTLLMFAGFSAYDIMVVDLKPQAKSPPSFDFYHLTRVAASVAVSLFLVKSLPRTAFATAPQYDESPKWLAALGVTASALSVVFTMIFVASPQAFYALGVEDSLIEWSSAILLFAGCGIFLYASVVLSGVSRERARTAAVISLGMGMLLFFLGMEEVSWFQRVIGYDTPAAFSANQQQEFNLHNFKTVPLEILYYSGTFGMLFLLPFLLIPVQGRMAESLRVVAPTKVVALACAPMAALNWGMWNILPIQVAFWTGVCVMSFLAVRRYRGGDDMWKTYGFVLLCLLFVQAVFLALGSNLIRLWGVTEYKEFYISVGFFVFAAKVLVSARAFAARPDPQ
ncbi:MAG: hypothetical protein COC12_03495 [Rhodobacteraceae bacterium]|nr:MAG: hypothetical protein COC12_03495 [Paracoccaceae bacterium]